MTQDQEDQLDRSLDVNQYSEQDLTTNAVDDQGTYDAIDQKLDDKFDELVDEEESYIDRDIDRHPADDDYDHNFARSNPDLHDEFVGDERDLTDDIDYDEAWPDEIEDQEDQCESDSLNLNALFSELSLKRGLIEVSGITRDLETDGKKYQLSDFKFATPYRGKHDFFRVIFNHDTKLCTMHVQIKTKVVSKYNMTQSDVFVYIYNELKTE